MMRNERGNAMMTAFWWNVFLAAVLTTIIAKLFRCPWNIVPLFSVSYIGWTVGLLLLLLVGNWVEDLWKRRKS